MSANAMIRKHIKPLLGDYPDLEIIGNLLVVKPIHHVLRAIVINSYNHDHYFYPLWAITHFCDPVSAFPSNWGERIFKDTQGVFLWANPDTPNLFTKRLDRDILPFLRSIHTLDDLVDQIQTPSPYPYRGQKIDELRGLSLQAARGDLEQARRNLDDLRSGRSRYSHPPWHKAMAAVVDPLGPLLDADDRPGIARQLAEWEAMRIAKLPKGFAGIWEPTPFPVETSAPHSS